MECASSPSSTSPRHTDDQPQSENDPPQSRVPRQLSITSASQIPNSPTRHSISSQLASPRYIKQFNALIEHQREVHSEERKLWHTERAELNEKIAKLEVSLRRYQACSSSQVSSPIDKNRAGTNSSFRSLPSTNGSRQTSTSGPGAEVWLPKTDIPPTRTFSESTDQASKPESRLPSIAENAPIPDTQESRQSGLLIQSPIHKPSISELQLDRNLDGINFKSSSIGSSTVNSIMTPQSPSPQPPSTSHVPSGVIDLPAQDLTAPVDPYIKDAGHTPLARRTHFNADGTPSAPSSDLSTPIQPEIERPPLEPHTTSVKAPSERSDSYFPASEDDSGDADPKLSGPLGLTNNQGEDKQFLTELDMKLLQAARSETFEPPAVAGASDPIEPAKEERDLDQSEHEPKLRIKRSMNFGSAFGARTCGKGL